MIVATSVRSADRLAGHLMSTRKNESARPYRELDINITDDTTLALRFCAAPASANARVKNELIHVIMAPAPGQHLDVAAWRRALAIYEETFAIGPAVPRHVVVHELGDRPPHVHVVYASVDPATGRAIRTSFSRTRDETVARQIEHSQGFALTPSVRAEFVARQLRQIGNLDTARAVERTTKAVPGRRDQKSRVLQAERAGSDRNRIDEEVALLWRSAERDLGRFAQLIKGTDYKPARGRRAIMLVHLPTGDSWPLGRQLKRIDRHAARTDFVRSRQIDAVFGKAPELDSVLTDTSTGAGELAASALSREYMLFANEADRSDREKAGKARKRSAAWAEAKREIRSIRAAYRARDRLRRQRVRMAFKIARILDTAVVRRTAFCLAAAGLLASGAGLVGALVAAGIAVQMIPRREDARQVLEKVDAERTKDAMETTRTVAALLTEAPGPTPPASEKKPVPPGKKVAPRQVTAARPRRKRDFGIGD